MQELQLEFACDAAFGIVADGSNGYWDSIAKGVKVTVTNIAVIGWWVDGGVEDSMIVRATHNLDADKYGLLYSNKHIENIIAAKVKTMLGNLVDKDFYCEGSEQGEQEADTWVGGICLRDGVTVDELKAAGFTVEE